MSVRRINPMVMIRYFQLCGLILKVILGGDAPCRKPRGDIRNFARSFYISYRLIKGKEAK